MLTFNTLSDFNQQKGKELPVGEWFTVTQEMINSFAEATLDKQWIHVDEAKAKQLSPFKSTVAHGFMSVALLSKKLEEVVQIKSVKMGLNYGVNKVRFPSPVPVNSELRLVSFVKDIEEMPNNGVKITFNCTMEIKNREKPACVAEFLAVMFE